MSSYSRGWDVGYAPEQGPLADIPFYQIIAVVSVKTMVMHPNEQEPIFLIGIRFSLILAVLDLQFLHWILVIVHFPVKRINPIGLLFQFGFPGDDTIHKLVRVLPDFSIESQNTARDPTDL